MWNYTWRTGVDNDGEPIHNTMYDRLYINAAKELHEFSYYTFMDHWGKATPSFPPRIAMRGYLEARFKKYGEPSWIKFKTVVKSVTFDEATQKFTVTTKSASEPGMKVETFDNVICCTGHFSFPNNPILPCYDDFKGTIIHSHDQRTFHNYKDKTVMVVGTSFSAEDIASIAWKHGATKIVCSYRNEPMGFKWPDCFETHPLPNKIVNKTVYFPDGGEAEVDYIVICAGFHLTYPFMEDKLRLTSPSAIVPDMLYKGVSLMNNEKCFYVGMQAQVYSFNMFDVQAAYVRDVVQGKLTLPSQQEKEEWLAKWKARQDKFAGYSDLCECQGDYITELLGECQYKKPWDTKETNKIFNQWVDAKVANIMTFRDQ